MKVVRGDGIYLYDEDGAFYIDCASATFNLSLGYSHPAIVEAIKQQADQLIHVSSSFQTDIINKLCSDLIRLAPGAISLAHMKVASGSEANEGAVKMAQRATGRRDVITLFRSHHGQTNMAASLSGNAFRRSSMVDVHPNRLLVPDPYCKRCFYGQEIGSCGTMCVDRIGDFIEFASRSDVAAIMIEPISGNGGNIVPPIKYFTVLQEFCRTQDIKIIVDEIQTGIGRTGYVFASDHFGLLPDAITVAKGLGGSGAQVAGVLATEELGGLSISEHSFTNGANLMAAAAAVKTLEIISEPAFLTNVREIGALILRRLNADVGTHHNVFDVRGLGLMIGVELTDNVGRPSAELANSVATAAARHGLILRTSRYGHGNVVKIRPPLILTAPQAEDICDRFAAALTEVLQ